MYGGATPVHVDLRRPSGQGRAGEGDTLIDIDGAVGGAGADVLIGNHYGNALYGGAGNDVLRGGGGDDYVDGQRGVDRLSGGPGYDEIAAGDGLTVVARRCRVSPTSCDAVRAAITSTTQSSLIASRATAKSASG